MMMKLMSKRPYMSVKYNLPPKAGIYDCKVRIGSFNTKVVEMPVRFSERMIKRKDTCCGDWMYIEEWRLTEEDLFYNILDCSLGHAISSLSEENPLEFVIQEILFDLRDANCTYMDEEMLRLSAEIALETIEPWLTDYKSCNAVGDKL